MALDPRLPLAIQVPSAGQAINIFENALMNSQTRDVRQQQAEQQALAAPFQQQLLEAEAGQAVENRKISDIATFGVTFKPELENAIRTGNTSRAQTILTRRLLDLQKRQTAGEDIDTAETVDAITSLRNNDPQQVLQDLNAIEQLAVNRGLLGAGRGQKQFALQSNAPITDPVSGQVSTPVFNPATGQTQLVPIEGAIQETPTQKAARAQTTATRLADLDVRTTQRKETIKKTVARTSEIKKEFSERRRAAARSKRKISEAQKLAEKATQGLAGASKVQLARVFPGIDVRDEAALVGAFKGLALDELQKFKGPTTDFEFRVTEDVAGSLGDGASANKARLASLERASWFADRESAQFNQHIKGGHNPDEFFFNFNELITPKKGGKSYSLQSLQDTAVANHMSIDEVIKRLSR